MVKFYSTCVLNLLKLRTWGERCYDEDDRVHGNYGRVRKHNDDDDNVDDDEDGKNDDDNNDYVYFDNEENGTDVIHHSELSKEMKIATLMPVMLCRVDTV